MKLRLVIFFFCTNFVQVFAQEGGPNYGLMTPYQTVVTHLKNLEEENYKPEAAARVFNPGRVDKEMAEKLAVQLL